MKQAKLQLDGCPNMANISEGELPRLGGEQRGEQGPYVVALDTWI